MLINEILSAEDLAAQNAKMSQIHRLGFDKLILMTDSSFQLHLHIWWPYRIHPKDGIHNHKFSFVSRILNGIFENNIYKRCHDNNPRAFSMHEYLANPLNTKQYDSFEYKGITKLIKTNSTQYQAGNVYHLNHEEFHTAEPISDTELTVTLFLKTNNLKDRDTIFEMAPFSSTNETTEIIKNKQLTTQEYKELLARYLVTIK